MLDTLIPAGPRAPFSATTRNQFPTKHEEPITGATTGKVEANNTAIKNIKRTARGYRNAANYKSVIRLFAVGGETGSVS